MRFLIVSDIHANLHGLRTVLEHVGGQYDQAVCLGDVVGYGAYPNECCELLRNVRSWCLRGNHDAAAIEQLSIADFNDIAAEAMLWTRRQLSVVNISWLESLRSSLDNAEHNFQAVHGSLRDTLEEYILDRNIARASLELMQRPVCFFGHTHVAESYSREVKPKQFSPVQDKGFLRGGQFTVEANWQYLINPGSCGQPRDGNPQARYALFDTATRRLEIRALDYDWLAARTAILEAGLPRDLGDRLIVGE